MTAINVYYLFIFSQIVIICLQPRTALSEAMQIPCIQVVFVRFCVVLALLSTFTIHTLLNYSLSICSAVYLMFDMQPHCWTQRSVYTLLERTNIT